MRPTVHVVPHTHWDREWYRGAAESQLRLAHLVDDVLERLERGSLPTFLLDGQGIVLDDYALARPARRARLTRLARRLECGPWYVLADNLLVSGEAMVRNLIEGGRAARRYGASAMRVGYAPDAFGHPAILPTVLAGFGIRTAVTWRGFGGAPGQDKDLYRWRGPDGAAVVMIHLPEAGYENGANLPVEPAAAAARWSALRAGLAARARSPFWLVLNGADHHAAQPDLGRAVRLLARLAPDCAFAVTGLSAYAARVLRWARRNARELPVIAGELREGRRHAWVLQGTHSARLYLKQANAACQRLLERVAEPLVSLGAVGDAQARGGGRVVSGLREDLRLAWRTLLENHPHDSICGTSADRVHREMMTRFDRVRAMGDEIAARALDCTIGHDPDAARRAGREAWRPALVMFNPSPARRRGVVVADVALFEADVRVGQQGPKGRQTARRPAAVVLRDPAGAERLTQELARWEGTDRLESPRSYPDCDRVQWRRLAIAAGALPPLGVSALAVAERGKVPAAGSRRRRSPALPAEPVRATALALSNGLVSVRVEAGGTLEVSDREGRRARGLAAMDCVRDEGDSYTSSPRGANLARAPDAVAVRLVHAGPLLGELEVARRYRRADLEVVTRVRVAAGARHVELELAFDNRHGGRRVRAAFSLGDRLSRVVADGPFGPVERAVRPVRRRAGDLEAPDRCAPMQRWVAVAARTAGGAAMTVLADGLPQYEARPDGRVLVTLLRSFDQMSRGDLPERPGHAGWPTPTPEARCLGPVRARLAVLLHGAAALDRPDRIEAAAEAFLTPPVAWMRRWLLAAPPARGGPELLGEGLVFDAMKPAESGRGVVLRCHNATPRAVRGGWRVPWRARSAWLARLDETPLARLAVRGDGLIGFEAPPRAVVTVLVRGAAPAGRG